MAEHSDRHYCSVYMNGTLRPQHTQDIDHVLVQCWPNVFDAGPTLNEHMDNVPCLLGRDRGPMLAECWASVVDSGPALKQHWPIVLCLLSLPQCVNGLPRMANIKYIHCNYVIRITHNHSHRPIYFSIVDAFIRSAGSLPRRNMMAL